LVEREHFKISFSLASFRKYPESTLLAFYPAQPMTHIRSILIALFLLSGCTALRVSYQEADIFLTWRADKYFDLNEGQKKDIRLRLQRLLAWHRYQQLPEYADFLSTAVHKAQTGLKHDDIVWFVNGLKARYRIIVDYGIADAAAMLETLTPEQIETLQKQWDKDNRDFVQEHGLDGTPAAHRQARLKLKLNEIEDWSGDLSRPEERQIASLLDQVPNYDELRYQERLRRQQEFLILLKMRADKTEFQTRLRTWLADWEQDRSPEYQRQANDVYEKYIQFYIAIEKVLTANQRRRALQRLQQYADDCRLLS
jgi:hypothetical protein